MTSDSVAPIPAVKLSIVIVGAGLGGLAASIALARKGFTVTLLEASSILGEVGAGIQIPPNSTALLKYLGLDQKFEQVIVWPKAIALRRYNNGDLLGYTPLNPYLTQRYGAPYWLIHRADYHRILHDAAVKNGIEIHTSSRVAHVDEDIPCVTLEDGRKFKADVIIGADGIRSLVRNSIFPELNDDVYVPSGSSAFRATVPADLMSGDSDLQELLDSPYATCWIGPGRHIMAYPIRNKTLYNLVMLHPGDGEPGVWNTRGSLDDLRNNYADWDPKLVKILHKVQACLKWKITYVRELPSWVSKSGRIALLGDSAHATVPFLAQGAAQAIEDSITIAECLASARSMDDVAVLLKLYENIRKARCTRVQIGSMKYGDVWHMPDGPEQEQRDLAMLVESNRLADETVDLVENDAAAEVPSYDLKNPNFWSDNMFQPWLFGHNAVLTAKYYLTKAGYQ
ncbi:3-hydroxybenzoate 6-hydroxylase-like protein [Limtongia smithiae]|uniref:3-hydroxybenzoate 6-hydroxylase-like protein n=1 Tax=Limtongia smithiae TaxID=1125753 RepID=UPI0034CEC5F0